MQKAEIGIIGGSGLYSMPGFTDVREEKVSTPFGEPSDAFVLGALEGRKVAFLARHGAGRGVVHVPPSLGAALARLAVDEVLQSLDHVRPLTDKP